MDADQALPARARDILGEIVEEHDALSLYPDRLYHMIIGAASGFRSPIAQDRKISRKWPSTSA